MYHVFFWMIERRDHGFIFNVSKMSVWVSKWLFAHRKKVNIIVLSQPPFLTIYIGCRIMYRFSMAIQTQSSFIIKKKIRRILVALPTKTSDGYSISRYFFLLPTFITHAVLDRRRGKKNWNMVKIHTLEVRITHWMEHKRCILAIRQFVYVLVHNSFSVW